MPYLCAMLIKRPGGFPVSIMSSEKRNKLSEIFKLAWQFVKRNGYKLSEALKCAWLNIKLKAEMKKRIVKFYFQKIDGSLREAYGTMNPDTIPVPTGTRKPADTVQIGGAKYHCVQRAHILADIA